MKLRMFLTVGIVVLFAMGIAIPAEKDDSVSLQRSTVTLSGETLDVLLWEIGGENSTESSWHGGSCSTGEQAACQSACENSPTPTPSHPGEVVILLSVGCSHRSDLSGKHPYLIDCACNWIGLGGDPDIWIA
jgi:hypothetical protein